MERKINNKWSIGIGHETSVEIKLKIFRFKHEKSGFAGTVTQHRIVE